MSRIPADVAAEVESRSAGWCEANLDGCRGRADAFHHRRGKQHNTADLIAHLCNDNCHNSSRGVHGNPDWSYRHGWLVRRNGIPNVFGPITGCDLTCDIDHGDQLAPTYQRRQQT